jgi:hypothetical protein
VQLASGGARGEQRRWRRQLTPRCVCVQAVCAA